MSVDPNPRTEPTKGNSPANCGAGHRRDDPGTGAPEETTPPELPLDDGRGVEEALGGPDLLVLRHATRLEQRLDHVQRGGDPGRDGTGQTTRHAVGEGVVLHGGVHDFGDGFVGHKLGGGEGNGHAEGGGVGDVEGLQPLGLVDAAGALGESLMNGAVDLHPLLDDWWRLAQVNQTRNKGCRNSPSNGFIKASLAIVAAAPLVA